MRASGLISLPNVLDAVHLASILQALMSIFHDETMAIGSVWANHHGCKAMNAALRCAPNAR
jgi:hypothetical protein